MEFKALLERQDIPDDAKAAIKRGIEELKFQQYISQQLADFEAKIFKLNSERVIQAAVDFFKDRFMLQRVAVAILDEEKKGFLVYAMTESDSSGIFKGSFIPFEKTYLSKVIEERKPHYRSNIALEKQEYDMDKKLIATNVRSVFYIPLIYERTLLGTLNVASNLIDAFSEDMRHLFSLLGHRLALALQNAILHNRLQETVKDLRGSEKEYKNLITQAQDGIVIVQDGLIKFLNPRLASMANLNFSEVINSPFMNYIHPDALSGLVDRYNKRMAGKDVPSIYESKLILKNGIPLDVEINASVISYQGKPADLAFIRDIGERKQAEQALRESEEKYRSILENIQDGYYEVDLNGDFTFFNEIICNLLGYNENEILGMSYKQYCDEKTAKIVFQTFNEVFRTRRPSKAFEWEIIRKDNTKKIVEASVSLITDSEGKPTGFRGLVRDISKRKQIEEELKESEARYRTLITTMNEGVWVTNLQNNTTFVNPALEKMMGFSLEELMGKNVKEFLHPDSITFFDEVTADRLIRGIPASTYELKWTRKDGSILITRVAGTALYNGQKEVIGSFGALSDITAEKQAQEALQKSEERYRRLIELSPDAITLTDLEFNIIAANQQAVIQNGAESAEELIGLNALELIHPEDRQRAIENAQETMSSRRIIQTEYRLLRKNGSFFPAELKASMIDDDEGNPTGFIAVTRDITDRKRVEDELREKAVLVEKMEEGVILEDTKGYITFLNPRAAELLGYTEEELIGNHWSYLVREEDQDKAHAESAKRPKGISSTYELTAVTKDRRHISVIVTATPLFTKTGTFKGVLDVFTDITERKKVEEALRQVKLEEEQYHAMLSHFLHNDLQKIISYSELISLKYNSNLELDMTNVNKIIEISSRSSKTIDTVNTIFEILQSPYIKPGDSFSLLGVINTAMSELSFPSQLIDINQNNLDISIFGDHHLKKVFSELLFFLLNACDEEKVMRSPILIEGSQIPSHLCVFIRDSCSQPIPPDICTRLSGIITEEWEAQGHYIGIALASVIMQHYGGSLKIQASEPTGNEFQILFPISMIHT
ncbi:MAG: PAS domain S-box protein [Candidatus Hermodarchaeota archaeon]